MYSPRMDRAKPPTELSFPPGSLEAMVLRAIELQGPLHGYGVARLIEQQSGERFRVEEGSLYPALRRLEQRGDVAAEWRESETGRRARFYNLTGQGRKRLAAEKSNWTALAGAMGAVLGLSRATVPTGAGA